jgi:peptide deformylase
LKEFTDEDLKKIVDSGPELKILQAGTPGVLYSKAKEVEKVTNKHKWLCNHMLRTMDLSNGVGLAAPQVGVPLRILVFRAPTSNSKAHLGYAMVNPVIIGKSSNFIESKEGCLSIPGKSCTVIRYERVVVKYIDPYNHDEKGERGVVKTLKLEGLGALIVQHEIDHLFGILMVDKAIETKDEN